MVFGKPDTGEVVIAYRGTDAVGDWLTNGGLIISQERQAAQIYAGVLRDYGIDPEGSNITFTGHSMGGGLAASMAVWFNRPAIVFDPAPTQKSATDGALVNSVFGSLGRNAPHSLRDYATDVPARFAAREANVSSYFATGSALRLLATEANTVTGSGQSHEVQFGTANMWSPPARVDMHAQVLLVAGLLSSGTFPKATVAAQRALPLVFEKSLYNFPPGGGKPSFLYDLVRSEQASPHNGKLTHFAADLEKLGANAVGLSSAAQDAMLAQAIEWYYWQGDDTGKEFFASSGGLLQYTTAKGEGLQNSSDRTSTYVHPWVQIMTAQSGLTGGRFLAFDSAFDQWNVITGIAGGAASARDAGKTQIFLGQAGTESFTGGVKDDVFFAGGGSDTLEGRGGKDRLYGGAGLDTYKFSGLFGMDTIYDGDGEGVLTLTDTGRTLKGGRGYGARNQWLGQGGEVYTFLVTDSPQIGSLTIRNLGAGNEIKIERFDLGLASSGIGYLGIKFGATQVSLRHGGGGNFWHFPEANRDTLEGRSGVLAEGSGTPFVVSLSQAASAGDTLVLSLAGLGGRGLQAILGNETVDADGAVIVLAEGQTQVSFALVQDGDLEADASGSLSVTYHGGDQAASAQRAISNAWGLELKDSGDSAETFNGDMLALTRLNPGPDLTRERPDGSTYIAVKHNESKFVVGNYDNLAEEDADADDEDDVRVAVTANTLYGSGGNDRINGLSGNDLLGGRAGNDIIDGGIGDDMIGGGAGDDRILGGDGNDFISSSADIGADRQQLGPQDVWQFWGLPADATAEAAGTTWGVYPDPADPKNSFWSGMLPTSMDTQSDSIDAGDGDDRVIASWGDDRVQGGKGKDRLSGLAGDDVLEGGDGDDTLDGDGLLTPGYLESVTADRHGDDFIDGGAGADRIDGGGGSDNIFGGAGKDTIYADGSGASDSQTFVELAFQGEDSIDGEDGDDYAEGGGKDDVIYGGAGKDTLWGDTPAANLKGATATDRMAWGDDYLDGEGDDDLLYGGGGDDTLYGGAGDDQLLGDDGPALAPSMHGDDYLDGEGGNDRLFGGGKDDILFGGAGDDYLFGDSDSIAGELYGDDYLDGEEGNDVLVGQGGADKLYGGAGDDQLQGDGGLVAEAFQGADFLDGGDGDDRLLGGGGDDTLIGGLGADQLQGDDGDDLLQGGAGDDILVGKSGDDILEGGEGSDFLDAGTGNDQLFGGAGDDFLNSGDGDQLFDGGDGDDFYGIYGTHGIKTLVDYWGTDTIDLGWLLSDTQLGHGSLLVRNTATGQEVHVEGFDADDAESVSPIELFVFSSETGDSIVLEAHELIEQLGFSAQGTAGDDELIGTPFKDILEGGAGDDVLVGLEGDDRLIGGPGADTLLGGEGDDVYVVDAQGADEILEVEGEGQDTIEASVDYSLAAANVETVLLTGTQAIDATGNGDANRLIGNGAANVLDGAAGADVLEGRGGDDTYRVDDAGDTVVEQEGGGTDTVHSSVSYVLPVHVENLVLTGQAQVATGNDSDNRLIGNDQDNLLRGKDGDDRMEGGAGSDTYLVFGDAGLKTIADESGDEDMLDLRWNVGATHLVLGSSPDELGVYNASTGQLVEIEGIDPLARDAMSPIETMFLTRKLFGEVIGVVVDIDEMLTDTGLSFFGSSRDETLSGSWRPDRMYGFSGSDVLFGLGGDDMLDGGRDADLMAGGEGDDVYFVSDPGDRIVEDADEGYDTVLAESDFSIQGTDVEELEMIDTEHHVGIGNDLDNSMLASTSGSVLFGEGGIDRMFGSRGDDRLHGGDGKDLLFGAEGNDVLAGDDGNDHLIGEDGNDILSGGNGDDLLEGQLGDDRLDGGAGNDILDASFGDDVLAGGDGDDILSGGEGRDELDGGAGDDTLFTSPGGDTLAGGSGDDIYRDRPFSRIFGFAQSGARIVEGVDGGIDTVIAYESFTLGDNVENLLLRQLSNGEAHLVGIGNAMDNRLEDAAYGLGGSLFGLAGDDVLVGGVGVNWLDGGTGADLMIGGRGRTDYVVDDVNDRVVALPQGFNDTVHSSIDYVLGESVEDLVLEDGQATTGTGNDLPNRIFGNGNDNILDGGIGSDVVRGGGGNDVLIGTLDHDSLFGGDGNDLLLGGDDGTTMFGDAGQDRLIGGVSMDHLDGGTGADVMIGGSGDDTYVVDNVADVVVEVEDGGSDTVRALIDYTLPGVFENLAMFGYGLTGIGNEWNNVITGIAGGERLFGLEGDDVLDAGGGFDSFLDGGAGRDTLISPGSWVTLAGGADDDVYKLGAGSVELVEFADGGYDRVLLEIGQFESAYLHLSQSVEELDASASAGDLFIQAGDDDNLILSGAGSDEIEGGGGDDRISGGQSRNAEIGEQSGLGIASAMVAFFSRGVPVAQTFERLLADFQGNVSQDSSQLFEPFAYSAWRVPASPDGFREPVPLFMSYWMGPPDAAQVLLIQHDGTLTWEGGGHFQEDVLPNWDPYTGPLSWDQLQAQYGLRTSVPAGESDAYLAVTGTGIPAPGQHDASDGRSYATVYWPKASLPADMQAVLAQQMDPGDGASALADALASAGVDRLDGDDGDDVLDGGDGNDLLFGGAGEDLLTGGADNDTITVSAVSDREEGYASVIVSNARPTNDDVLDGGAGVDRLVGGSGNDTYYVDGESAPNPQGRVASFDGCDVEHRFGMDGAPLDLWLADTVVESPGEGSDTVIASASVVLANVETVVLSQVAQNLDIDATTGAGSQTLVGNTGRNTLNGGAGADIMSGGRGDDTYVVDDAGDVVAEAADEGRDIVRTTLDGYVLGDNLEALVLDGGEDLSASGNELSNVLIGNSGDNAIDGGAGDDILAGWRGDDLLRGGEGFDSYYFSRGDGNDVVEDAQGGQLHFSGDIRSEELSFRMVERDLLISVGATEAAQGVHVTLRGWLDGGENRISQISYCVDNEVDWMDEFIMIRPKDDVFTVGQGETGTTGNVFANDADASLLETMELDFELAWEGPFGSARIETDGSFEFVLNADSDAFRFLAEGEVATDSFNTYGVSDRGTGRSLGYAQVQIDVTGSNDAPAVFSDETWVSEDWEFFAAGNVLDNDFDFDGDAIAIANPGSQAGAVGTLEMTSSGDYEYTLNNDDPLVQTLGWDSWLVETFEYVVVDSHGAESVGTLEVFVYGDNDLPVGVDDEVSCAEDGPGLVGNVLANDFDIDIGDVVSVYDAGLFAGLYGVLQLDDDGAYAYALDNSLAAVQSLGAGRQLKESFVYTVSDFYEYIDEASLNITIVGVNDGPVAVADLGTVAADGAAASGNVLANDSDPDAGDVLSVADAGLRTGGYGQLALSADGSYTYAVAARADAVRSLVAGQRVDDVFSYELADSQGATDEETLTIAVLGVNDGPELVEDSAAAAEDGPAVSGNVLTNDSDPDAGDSLSVSNPGTVSGQYGKLTLAADGAFAYAVDNASTAVQALGTRQHARETYAYTVSDALGASATSHLSIDIVGVNDGPVAQADTASVSEDGVLSTAGNLLANDSDVDAGDTLSVSDAGTRAGQYGTLLLSADGAYSYSLANSSSAVQALASGQKVADVFAYSVSDSHGATAASQLTVDITGADESSCGLVLNGTDRDDRLVGSDCADSINGGKGSDTMVGGKGDDTYFVDTASAECRTDDDRDGDRYDSGYGGDHGGDDHDGHDSRDGHGDRDDSHGGDDCGCAQGDSVVELANGGIDTVASSVDYVLPQHVENLMLLGSAPRTGSGNALANVIVGSGGASILSGAAGNDVLVGRSAADTLDGGTGDDRLYGEGGNDKLDGGQGADRLWGGVGNDVLRAGEGDNLAAGGDGDDTIACGSGSDVVVAGAGNDRITTGAGNDFVDGGAGNDLVDSGAGSDFVAAGKGSDVVTTGAGRDVVAFNRGDGRDVLLESSGSGRGSGDVLSLGGGIRYADLTLRKTGQDLVLGLGGGDQITSTNWYSGQESRDIAALQMVTVGGDYNATSTSKLLNKRVVAFDFATIAKQYEAARKANSSLGAWALLPALNAAFLGASNTDAFGGDMAFDYATAYGTTQGYGRDMSVDAVRKQVQEQTGSNWQAASAAPAAPPGSTLVDPWVALQAGTDLVVGRAAGASNPITPTNSPETDSLLFAALAAGGAVQPSWAAR